MKIFTLGYQAISKELYVQTLVNAGVGVVLDVRENAWSMRREFIKSSLQHSLATAGIQYCHVKAAGNPAANRKTARSAAECLRRYRSHLKDNSHCLESLLLAIKTASDSQRPACITCYERAHNECHRSVLVDELTRRASDLTAIHLEPFITPKVVKHRQRIVSSKSPFGSAFVAPAFLPFM